MLVPPWHITYRYESCRCKGKYARLCLLEMVGNKLIILCLCDFQNATSFMVEAGHPLKNVTTKDFAGAVVDGILQMNLSNSTQPARLYIPVAEVDVPGEGHGSPMSNLTDDSSMGFSIGETVSIPTGAPVVPGYFLKQHTRLKLPKSKNRARNRSDCRLSGCKQRTSFQCIGCNRAYCVPESVRKGPMRYCFYIHVAEAFIESGHAGRNFRVNYDAWLESLTMSDDM